MQTVTRLDMTLRTAAIPIAGLEILDAAKRSVRIDFLAAATAADRTAAATIVAGFDFSDAANIAFDATLAAQIAKDKMSDAVDDQTKRLEAAVKYLLQQIKVAVPTYNIPSAATVRAAIVALIS